MNRTLVFLIFISVVISVYSLMNYYFIKKHKNIISFRSCPGVIFGMVIFTLMITPILTIFFSRYGNFFFASVFGFIGYSWLAFLFLFLSIHLTVDLVLFIFNLFGRNFGNHTAHVAFGLTMLLSISILFYGRHEAEQIQIERLTIQTTKIKDPIAIVQLSDIHFSALTGVKTAKKLVASIEKESPDLIIFTGDFVDKGVGDSKEISHMLRQLIAPMGKYAITGNHEFITGIKESTRFIQASGFEMLRNESVSVGDGLNLVAVDDRAAKMFGDFETVEETSILRQVDSKKYTIFLKHQPHVLEESIPFFDLQLSGHTHAGQIFPFSLLVKIVFPYISGLYELDGDTKLYVSRGTGTWGPPFRFLAPPEITVITLVRD